VTTPRKQLAAAAAQAQMSNFLVDYIGLISVKSFEAKGDGVTNDTQAILDTVEFATENDLKSIFFPHGTYLVDAGLGNDLSGFFLWGDNSTVTGDTITINQIGNNITEYTDEFTGLIDTPSSFSTYGGRIVAVKSNESGLEFVILTADITSYNSTGNVRLSGNTVGAVLDQLETLLGDIAKINVNAEVAETHLSVVKSKTFDTLKNRLEESEQDHATHLADTTQRAINVKHPPSPLTAAVGDGVSDDTTAIQAILNYLGTSGGGIVYFPNGTYVIGSTISVPANITIQGAGVGATTFINGTTFLSGDIFSTTGSEVCYKDFTIKGTLTGTTPDRTSGSGIFTNKVNTKIFNIAMTYMYDCITVMGPGGNTWLTNLNLNCTHYCIHYTGDDQGNSSTDLFITDVLCWTTAPTTEVNPIYGVAGLYWDGGEAVFAKGLYVYGYNDGLVVDCKYPFGTGEFATNKPTTTQGWFDLCCFDTCKFAGIYIATPATPVSDCGNMVFIDCWAVNTGWYNFTQIAQSNVAIVGGGTPVDGIVFSGLRCGSAGGDGITLNNCQNINISGSMIGGSGSADSGPFTHSGVVVQNCNHVNINNNRIGQCMWSNDNQNFGIAFNGTNDYINITANDLSVNKTGGIYNPGIGTHSLIDNNIGYNPVGYLASQPVLPASTVAYTNNTGLKCRVFISGGTVTAIAINGTATGLLSGEFTLGVGETIAITYSAAPTWKWFGL
jgi:hypothetical protein